MIAYHWAICMDEAHCTSTLHMADALSMLQFLRQHGRRRTADFQLRAALIRSCTNHHGDGDLSAFVKPNGTLPIMFCDGLAKVPKLYHEELAQAQADPRVR